MSEMAFIGRKACGCVECAMMEPTEKASAQYRKDFGREIGKWVKRGLTIEKVPVEEARQLIKRCECGKAMKQAKTQPAQAAMF